MQLTYAWALYAREVRRFTKLLLDTLFSPIISAGLYLAVFGVVLGDTVVDGVSYVSFVHAGLLAMLVINSSFSNPGFGLIIAKNTGTFVDLQLAPLAPWKINLAYACAATTRAIMTMLIAVAATAWFVPGLGVHSLPWLALAVALTGLEFGLLGVAFGMYAKNFEAMTFMNGFILQPMIFLSGVFYPIATLPGAWSSVAAVNPLHHNVNLLRYAFTGYSDGNPLVSLAVVFGALLLMLGVTHVVTSRKLQQ